jgi:hypothetical protein
MSEFFRIQKILKFPLKTISDDFNLTYLLKVVKIQISRDE